MENILSHARLVDIVCILIVYKADSLLTRQATERCIAPKRVRAMRIHHSPISENARNLVGALYRTTTG